MIVSIHQPAYLPWLGYFDKIKHCDIFVFLDNVQYEKNSFINRNRIRDMSNQFWLTIPISSADAKKNINEIYIANNNWKRKHLTSIYLNYKSSPNFEKYYAQIEDIINNDISNLADYLFSQLNFWLQLLNINTKIIRASSINSNKKKSDLILDLCLKLEASEYISGINGKNYLITEDFFINKINITYQNFKHPVYKQKSDSFIPNLSVVDYIFNSSKINLEFSGRNI